MCIKFVRSRDMATWLNIVWGYVIGCFSELVLGLIYSGN